MPFRGGAIPAAILPPSWTVCLRERTCVLSPGVGQPPPLAPLPFVGREQLPVWGGLDRGERADLAVERHVRQLQHWLKACAGQDPVPPLDAALAVGDVLAAQVGVEPRP